MPLSPNVVALQVLRAVAVLPAAGAWDAAPTEINVDGAQFITLFFSYTRGGAGGSFRFLPQVSPYSADQGVATIGNWFPPSVRNVAGFVIGADVAVNVQRLEGDLYTAVGATLETFSLEIELGASAQRFRCACQEVGNVALPGAAHIIAYLRG